MPSSRLRAFAILAIMPLLFASNLTIGRAAIDTVLPWTLACTRWFLTSLVLLPLAWSDLRQHAQAIRSEAPRFLLLGFLGMWICGGIVYLSLRYTTATHAALVYTSSPVMVVVLVAVLARKPLPLPQILGVVLAITGVALTATEGNLVNLVHFDFNIGDLGIFFCSTAWAIYSLVLKRKAFEAIPTIASFFVIAVCGVIFLVPCMIYETITIGGFPTTARAWLSIASIVIFASLLSYSAYQYNVRTVGPAVTSIFMYLMPGYGIAIAVMFLGETFRFYHAVSLLLLIGGVVLATGTHMLAGFARRHRNAA